jgi:hypothetical protein
METLLRGCTLAALVMLHGHSKSCTANVHHFNWFLHIHGRAVQPYAMKVYFNGNGKGTG